MYRAIFPRPSRAFLTLATSIALAVPLASHAHDSMALQRYRQERADCLAGRTDQGRATCLYEARSALRDARAGKLTDADPATLAANALRRCEPVPVDVKDDCERLVRGLGEQEQTVAYGGGVSWVAHDIPVGADDHALP